MEKLLWERQELSDHETCRLMGMDEHEMKQWRSMTVEEAQMSLSALAKRVRLPEGVITNRIFGTQRAQRGKIKIA